MVKFFHAFFYDKKFDILSLKSIKKQNHYKFEFKRLLS